MDLLSLIHPPLCHAFYSASLVKKGEYHYLMENRWAIHAYLGKGQLTIDGETEAIRPGMVSITPPGRPSLYQVDGDFFYIYSHFTPQGQENSHGLSRFLATGKEMVDLIKRGAEQYPLNPCLGRALLWQILLELGEKQIGEVVENKQSWVSRARRIIDKNLFSPFSLTRFSRELGISAAHLNRLFKKEKGMTVYQYVMGERMKRIKYFITQTDVSLKQIALESGYDDLQQFNKNCRRYLGNSPRNIRNSSMIMEKKERGSL